MRGGTGWLAADESSLPLGGACEHLRDYAVGTRGRQYRTRVLIAAEVASRGGGQPQNRQRDTVALALELAHLASLAHDDVMDGGQLRRGKPSLPAAFGARPAAAFGGALYGRSVRLFASCGEEILQLATAAAVDTCAGQLRDVQALYDTRRTRAEYLEVVKAKTAALFRAAAALGGILGNAEDDARRNLANYGEAIGVAYQIIDDVRDLVAAPNETGKPLGGDLHIGNYTLPVIYALDERPALAEELREGAQTVTVAEAVLMTEGVARASAEAEQWIAEARHSAEQLKAADGLLEIAAELAQPMSRRD